MRAISQFKLRCSIQSTGYLFESPKSYIAAAFSLPDYCPGHFNKELPKLQFLRIHYSYSHIVYWNIPTETLFVDFGKLSSPVRDMICPIVVYVRPLTNHVRHIHIGIRSFARMSFARKAFARTFFARKVECSNGRKLEWSFARIDPLVSLPRYTSKFQTIT